MVKSSRKMCYSGDGVHRQAFLDRQAQQPELARPEGCLRLFLAGNPDFDPRHSKQTLLCNLPDIPCALFYRLAGLQMATVTHLHFAWRSSLTRSSIQCALERARPVYFRTILAKFWPSLSERCTVSRLLILPLSTLTGNFTLYLWQTHALVYYTLHAHASVHGVGFLRPFTCNLHAVA